MSATELTDLSRLAIHTMTHKPWSLAQCIEAYTRVGAGGISVWRDVIEPIGAAEAGRMLRDSGLSVPALVRGGFFPAFEAAHRQRAIDENRACVDEAAAIGAEMVVLVVGAVPGIPLAEARRQVAEGIAAVLPHAQARDVKLAIEPLHPMYAADRSAVNTMRQAREMCEMIDHPLLGIAVDVYHVWWDDGLKEEIKLAGQQKTLFALHVCDWRVDTRSLLTDRGLMGDGCIDVRTIRGWVEDAGFRGFHEVEVFSDEYWAMDQTIYVDRVRDAYLKHT